MKSSLLLLGIVVATAGIGSRAEAQNYPWCEYLGGFDGGGRNCGFVSFAQCMASAAGTGGDCRQNTLYEPPAGSHAQPSPAPGLHRHHARQKSHKNS
jgi:hypothetical protein